MCMFDFAIQLQSNARAFAFTHSTAKCHNQSLDVTELD